MIQATQQQRVERQRAQAAANVDRINSRAKVAPVRLRAERVENRLANQQQRRDLRAMRAPQHQQRLNRMVELGRRNQGILAATPLATSLASTLGQTATNLVAPEVASAQALAGNVGNMGNNVVRYGGGGGQQQQQQRAQPPPPAPAAMQPAMPAQGGFDDDVEGAGTSTEDMLQSDFQTNMPVGSDHPNMGSSATVPGQQLQQNFSVGGGAGGAAGAAVDPLMGLPGRPANRTQALAQVGQQFGLPVQEVGAIVRAVGRLTSGLSGLAALPV